MACSDEHTGEIDYDISFIVFYLPVTGRGDRGSGRKREEKKNYLIIFFASTFLPHSIPYRLSGSLTARYPKTYTVLHFHLYSTVYTTVDGLT